MCELAEIVVRAEAFSPQKDAALRARRAGEDYEIKIAAAADNGQVRNDKSAGKRNQQKQRTGGKAQGTDNSGGFSLSDLPQLTTQQKTAAAMSTAGAGVLPVVAFL
jgi:hypothetical protein